MSTTACRNGICPGKIHLATDYCPVCAEFAGPPNVRHAEFPEEREALEKRYVEAREATEKRGCAGILKAFEAALGQTQAVIALPTSLATQVLAEEKSLYSTYYQQVGADCRIPAESSDSDRRKADETVFPGYKEKIRFAALTLDGRGLPNYGGSFFVLRDQAIAQRASVFEENSFLFADRHNFRPPRGYRAAWAERAKVGVAKLAGSLETTTPEDHFAGILMAPGATRREDRFVEVHVWGPISAQSFESALLQPREVHKTVLKGLQERLSKAGVKVTIAS